MTAPNIFAGARLDRAGPRRADGAWLAERLEDPASRALAVTDGGVVLEDGLPARFRLGDLGGEPLLLGVEDDGAALFAVDAGRTPPPGDVVGVRDAGAVLDQADGGLVAYASALANWHRRHPRCSVCGAPTEVREGGHLRACPSCGAQHHPRTDPVVIMVVIDRDADRVLLGRQATWPAGRYSALAGFVEPGESLEEAVAREVGEEAGVRIAGARYVSSQPWPFPMSLMLGFHADYAGGEAAVHDRELEDVRWFTRAELREAAEERGPYRLPPPLAIARRLVDDWMEART